MISKELKEWAEAYDAIMPSKAGVIADTSIQDRYIRACLALRKSIVPTIFAAPRPKYNISFNPVPKPSSTKKVRGKKDE